MVILSEIEVDKLNNNIVGLDWDNISLTEAKHRQKTIEKKEQASTILFQTKNGFHLEIIYDIPISVEKNFEIRKKYYDCKQRLRYSPARHETTGEGYDILFNMKRGIWRKMI